MGLFDSWPCEMERTILGQTRRTKPRFECRKRHCNYLRRDLRFRDLSEPHFEDLEPRDEQASGNKGSPGTLTARP